MSLQGFAYLVFVVSLSLNAFGQAATSDVGPGIMIEKPAKDCKLEDGWPREGDVLLSWIRGDRRADFGSPFDLPYLQIEERPRGLITVQGARGTEKRSWILGSIPWCLTARPIFSPGLFSTYLEADRLLGTNALVRAKEQWRSMARKSPATPWLYPWLLYHGAGVLQGKNEGGKASRMYQHAAEAGEQLPPWIASELLRAAAHSFRERGERVEAERYYQRRLLRSREVGEESLLVSTSLFCLGALLVDENPAKARDYLGQAIAIQEKLASASLDLTYSLTWAEHLAEEEGNLDEAERLAQHALAIEHKLPSAGPEIAFSLIALGSIMVQRGNLSGADNYYLQALAVERRRSARSRNMAVAITQLANNALIRGELPKAEYFEQQALAIRQQLAPDGLDVADSLMKLGGICSASGRPVEAEKYELRSARIFQRLAPKTSRLAEILNHLGDINVVRARFRRAMRYYHRALAIEERLSLEAWDKAISLQGLGDLYSKIGDLSKAEQNYRGSLAIIGRISEGTTFQSVSLALLASTLRRRQRLDEASRLYSQVFDALDSQTARLGGGSEVHSTFRAQYQDYYREFVDLLLHQHQPERAFEVLERSRARGLLETLTSGHIDVHKGIDPVLQETEHSLQQKLSEKSNLRLQFLSQRHSEDRVHALDNEITDLRLQQQNLQEQIRSNSPAYAALTQPHVLSAKEVQQQLLDENTVLLEYSLGEERSYLFALTPTILNTYTLPSRKKIERAARRVYTLLRTGNHPVRGETRRQKQVRVGSAKKAYSQATAELSRMILAPAAAELQGKRLLIVSDGALAYIPFAILPTPEGVPFMAKHEIVNLPSASVLAVLRQQEQGRARPAKAVAVLADPVFSKDDPRVSRRHPGNQLAEPLQPKTAALRTRGGPEKTSYDSFEAGLPAHLLQRSIGDVQAAGQLHLNRLPFTRMEAQAIAAAVPIGESLEALDFQASRATATSPELAQYRIVHFATHGLLDSRHPELSGLVLSLVNEQGQPENGFLELQDVYNLTLAADMVVLSACETGLGQQVDGEGLIGLTRGFMYAGASRVMASLWRVDDEATAQLMKKFYEGVLKLNQTPAQALREAQLWMQSETRWKQPYYWAGFVLQGEWK